MQLSDRADALTLGRAALLLGLAAVAGHAWAGEPMSFFVTSQGNGVNGGNYGGLSGADARCQALAELAGAGDRRWVAYLSTAPIEGVPGELVHARDRIGPGPWHNFAGLPIAVDLDSLHAEGILEAHMLTELGDQAPANDHDILTGTLADGTAMTEFPFNPDAPPPNCLNWTSNSADAYARVGHTDASSVPGQSWNSQHETLCDEAGLAATLGSGRLYCFAVASDDRIFIDGFEPRQAPP